MSLPLADALARLAAAYEDPDIGTGIVLQEVLSAARPLVAQASPDTVAQLVAAAARAADAREPTIVRRFLDLAVATALGDPHVYCLRPDGLRPVTASEVPLQRRAAFAALAARADDLARMAAADMTPAPHPEERWIDPVEIDAVRGARLAIALVSGAPAGERETWDRAFAIVWGDGEPVASADDPPLVRAAAAIARGRTDDLASVVGRSRTGWGQPWAPVGLFAELGAPSGVALLSPAAARAMDPTRVGSLTRALAGGLERIEDQRSLRAALAGILVRFTMHARAAVWPEEDLELPIPLASDLAAHEREVLLAVATRVSPFQWNYDVHHSLFGVSLPATWEGCRRWLGVDPASPSERTVTIASESLCVGIAANRVFHGTIDAKELGRAMAREIGVDDLLELASGALRTFDYHLHCAGPPRSESERQAIIVAILLASLEQCSHDALVAAADRALVHDRGIDDSPSAILLALARSGVLHERFDLLVSELMTRARPDAATARTLLETLPEARRDALILHARARKLTWAETPDFTDLLSERGRPYLAEPSRSPILDEMALLVDQVKKEAR